MTKIKPFKAIRPTRDKAHLVVTKPVSSYSKISNFNPGKKYYWCSCGLSAIQPFCDGSHKAHKNEDGSSVMKSVQYVASENQTVYFCGCKHSKNGIFCDGTHAKI